MAQTFSFISAEVRPDGRDWIAFVMGFAPGQPGRVLAMQPFDCPVKALTWLRGVVADRPWANVPSSAKKRD